MEYSELEKIVEFNADGIMVIDHEGFIVFLNTAAATMLGETKSELLGQQFGHPLIPGESTEIELLSANGEIIVTEMRTQEMEWAGKTAVLTSIRDVTERKQELRENVEELAASYENAPLIMMLVDEYRKIRKVNTYTSNFVGASIEKMQGKRVGEILNCQHFQYDQNGCDIETHYCEQCSIRNIIHETMQTGKEFHQVEVGLPLIRQRQVKQFTFLGSTTLLQYKNGPLVLISCIDITERKKMEEKLREKSFYDSLTGLYNRNFFDEEMKRLSDGRETPLGIIICDLDGLKFINDTLGHQTGDQMLINVAHLFRRNLRSSDIFARIGGDEFAVLLTRSDRHVVEQILQRLHQAVQEYNSTQPEIPLSLSLGCAVEEGGTVDMQALFREADNRMYREKIQREGSARSGILQVLTGTLQARDFDTEGHCERLRELCTSLARSLDLPQDFLNDVDLLARFHDLGKVGIPDQILFKPGALTEEEWGQMRQHCEIGCRIASSVPYLEPLADFILKHHERWDGRGYPLGLSGQDIPLPCRILAVVDAYDAMISDRPYRKAMAREEAIAELKRCAGTQFDPELVVQFIQILEQFDSETSITLPE